jgi:hypothetical protein
MMTTTMTTTINLIIINNIIIIIVIIIIAMDSPSPNDLITSRSANYLNKRELSASQGVERFHGQVVRSVGNHNN